MKKLLIFLILSIFLISFTSAVCTISFSKSSYNPTETAIVTATCDNNNERVQSFTINFTNSSNTQVGVFTGTTPATINTLFYANFIIPVNYAGKLTANMTGTNLEGGNQTNVTGAALNTLLITNIINSGKWVGLVSSTRAIIKDENNKKITGALCHIHVYDSTGINVLFTADDISLDGDISFSSIASYENFKEGLQYRNTIHCYCDGNQSSTAVCIDEDGISVTNSIGSADSSFTMNQWVTFNDNESISYANGTLAPSNNIIYAGYGDRVYWYSNKTNNYGEQLTIKSREFLINSQTLLNGLSAVQDFSMKSDNTSILRLHELEIPAWVPTGQYYIRNYFDVYYKNILVGQYIVRSNDFNITGTADSFKFSDVLMDKSNYYTGEDLHICANITSTFNQRVEFEISYRYRCGQANDITQQVSIDSYTEIRGVNPNTNQVRCADLFIPYSDILLYKTSSCQAIVTIKSDYIKSFDNKITIQGNLFNITDYAMYPTYEKDPSYPNIKIYPDWRRFDNSIDNIAKSYYRAKINLTQLREIDLDPTNIISDSDWDIYLAFTENMPCSADIFNYSVEYENGTIVKNHVIENKALQWIDENGQYQKKCSLGIENINFSNILDDYFIVKVWYEDFDERQTNSLEGLNSSTFRSANALEGIENKTGTFRMMIDCPSTGIIDNTMTCIISAQVEDNQLVEKEVAFTCYIKDNNTIYSSTSFNKMITRNISNISTNFLIPNNLSENSINQVYCEANYYNLGSRTDTFYDSFIVKKASVLGGFFSPDGWVKETYKKLEEIIVPEKFKQSSGIYMICFFLVVFLILCLILILIVKKLNHR